MKLLNRTIMAADRFLCKCVESNMEMENTKKIDNPYWERVSALANRQRNKGIETYGQGLENNVLPVVEKLTYIEEELIDALMYIEWVKDGLVGGDAVE